MGEHRFTSTTFLIWSGLLIWAADFLILYTFGAITCARGWSHVRVFGLDMVIVVSLAVTFVALGAAAWVASLAWRRLQRQKLRNEADAFIYFVTLALVGLGVLGIVWNLLPVLFFGGQCYPAPATS